MAGPGGRPSGQDLFAHPRRPSTTSIGNGELDAVVRRREWNTRMRWIQKLTLRWRAAFRRTQVEREMEAELAAHLESEINELIARGVAPAEARRLARATMGRFDSIKEDCRDSRGTAGWEQ